MSEASLQVFPHKSEFIDAKGKRRVFLEGKMSKAARRRYLTITKELGGFLDSRIAALKKAGLPVELALTEEQCAVFEKLIGSITSEVGRALVGLTILQLCVKTISPSQSIRLHKGGLTDSQFSWEEGISMRVLDKSFITPVLRKHDLLKLNADGFMMTRSLAENYPYSDVYKANMKGARKEWLAVVDDLESGKLNPEHGLLFALSLLINHAADFIQIRDEVKRSLEQYVMRHGAISLDNVQALLLEHIQNSDHSARLFEIMMHALFQALGDLDLLKERLLPLSQMRSANKKHGNIGDIELEVSNRIVESWDAKFGKAHLFDELGELQDKLETQPTPPDVVGFVVSGELQVTGDVKQAMEKIEKLFDTSVVIISIDDWVKTVTREHQGSLSDVNTLAEPWLRAYFESIAQLRRHIAPIDEPCLEWVKSFGVTLDLVV